jgi:hypothetical protein
MARSGKTAIGAILVKASAYFAAAPANPPAPDGRQIDKN